VRRSFGWRLAGIKPSENEAKALDSNDTPQVMQSYLVWRRSSMFLSLFILALHLATAGYDDYMREKTNSARGYYKHLSKVGVTFLVAMPFIADTVLILGVIYALCDWKEWQKTAGQLKYGWLLATVMPLIPALVPVVFFLKDDNKLTADEITVEQGKVAIRYVTTIVPLIISFPASCVRAALRIRGLIPDSSFSSWIISIAAPFQSLLVLVSLILPIQMMGDGMLVAGALLLCLAPWLYVFRRNLYVSVSNDEKEKKIDVNQMIMMCMTIVSVILLFTWAHTFKVDGTPVLGMDADDPFFTYNYLFKLLFEYVGRLLLSTVVFGDTILCMTVENFWHNHSRLQDQDTSKRIQDTFESLEYITSRKLASAEADLESQDSTP